MQRDLFVLPPAIASLQAKRANTLATAAQAGQPRGATPFAKTLARATAARKPYASPLKAQQQAQPLPQPQAQRRTSTSTTSYATSPSTSRSSSTSKAAPKDKPQEPVRAPETPPTQTTPQPTNPLPLDAFPHPNRDNGRGMHWIPTAKQPRDVVDRFVAEAQRMGVKWITFLNDGAKIGENDYLVDKLVSAGIEPVMRLYSEKLQPIKGDIEAMVRHYTVKGVHYFQPHNEPNLNVEQPDGVVSVDRYLDAWIPAAEAIVRGGGLPGFGSLAPGGDMDDQQFLGEALQGLRERGKLGLLDRAWLSMHNYTLNQPVEERADGSGFFKFRAYHKILREQLGRDMPMIGTEGGTFIGQHEDKTHPPVTAQKAVEMAQQAYRYMKDQREPWNFVYSFWTIANEAGGGHDQSFREHALFRKDGSVNPVVHALRALG
jgi:hypothetical protein